MKLGPLVIYWDTENHGPYEASVWEPRDDGMEVLVAHGQIWHHQNVAISEADNLSRAYPGKVARVVNTRTGVTIYSATVA